MPDTFYGPELAAIHHQFYSESIEDAAPGVIAMLRARRIKCGLVLDIGCGAGQLSGRLLRAGFTPVGIDISPAMLRIARREWPTSRFIRGSIVNMRLPQAAAAVAIGEVFNYLKSKQDLQRAFHNVFSALNPGGVLICDIKEALPGRQRRYRSNVRWGKDWAIAVEVEEDPRANRLTRQIVMFRKSGRLYQRTRGNASATDLPRKGRDRDAAPGRIQLQCCRCAWQV
jgi:SAM-dependent methyltransferase